MVFSIPLEFKDHRFYAFEKHLFPGNSIDQS